ncbi:MAG: hypothetical protein HYS26_00760 [Candidatus Kaiserbacteria bacterium]|nr:MAG: hypothetical protein HYS26_00760 [Candidatus Kaiserbacteria bacterium]
MRTRLTQYERAELRQAYVTVALLEIALVVLYALLSVGENFFASYAAALITLVATGYMFLRQKNMSLGAASFMATGIIFIVVVRAFELTGTFAWIIHTAAAAFALAATAFVYDSHTGHKRYDEPWEQSHSRWWWRLVALSPIMLLAAYYLPADIRWQSVAAAANVKFVFYMMIEMSWHDREGLLQRYPGHPRFD